MDYNCIDYNCMYGLQVYGLQQELRTRAMFRVKVKPRLGPRGNATALDTVVGLFFKKKILVVWRTLSLLQFLKPFMSYAVFCYFQVP